jgi:hypothetical protein
MRHCPRSVGLELQVEAQCVVDLHHQMGRYAADHGTYPLDRDRTHLFGLGLGGLVDSPLLSGEHPHAWSHVVTDTLTGGDRPPPITAMAGIGARADDCRSRR